MSMAVGTARVLRAFEFRRVLLLNGLLNAASILPRAPLSPDSPAPVVAAVRSVDGQARAVQFSVGNSIAFADIAAFTDIAKQQLDAAKPPFITVFQLARRLELARAATGVRLRHLAPGWLGPGLLPAVEFLIAFELVAVPGWPAPIDALWLYGTAVMK
jgi:hypothetical protein